MLEFRLTGNKDSDTGKRNKRMSALSSRLGKFKKRPGTYSSIYRVATVREKSGKSKNFVKGQKKS